MFRILPIGLLLTALVTGCAERKSSPAAGASEASDRDVGPDAIWFVHFQTPPPADYRAPGGSGPLAYSFRSEWTKEFPNTDDPDLIGAERTDPKTGQRTYFTAEELRRISK